MSMAMREGLRVSRGMHDLRRASGVMGELVAGRKWIGLTVLRAVDDASDGLLMCAQHSLLS